MRLLLDTHTLLWLALGDPRLSARALELIHDPASVKLVSPASYWEIAIKMRLGKYTLHQAFEEFFRNAIDLNGFRNRRSVIPGSWRIRWDIRHKFNRGVFVGVDVSR
jgi:PIN domain nuclease of toxin-antitoxin system